MATILQYGLYIGMAAVVIVLIAGLVNITRTNEEQASMSNKLMRARVIAQAFVVGILVLLGIVLGSIQLF